LFRESVAAPAFSHLIHPQAPPDAERKKDESETRAVDPEPEPSRAFPPQIPPKAGHMRLLSGPAPALAWLYTFMPHRRERRVPARHALLGYACRSRTSTPGAAGGGRGN